MKRFRFQMEALLRLRKLEEDRRLTQFRQRQKAVMDAGREIERLEEEHAAQVEKLGELEQGELDMNAVLLHRRHLVHLQNQGREAQQLLQDRQRLAKEAKIFLDEAMCDRKAVERLKDRRYEEYMEVFRREEQKETDEVASQRFGRIEPANQEPSGELA